MVSEGKATPAVGQIKQERDEDSERGTDGNKEPQRRLAAHLLREKLEER